MMPSQAPPPASRTQRTRSTEAGGRKRKRTDEDEIAEEEVETGKVQTTFVAMDSDQSTASAPEPPVVATDAEAVAAVARDDPASPIPICMEEALDSANEHVSKGSIRMAAGEILKEMAGDRREY
ncbi:hypothetical protein AC579_2329 [Pseudocercospora musae]|uniref:Uncharacterized protein n=1 Tax=Pseudocercospora musae TaxID=113226 RepID=A0A139H3S5_9PEZI|nr:hypothetical protein AC579_2329 [Pseudocercospora musae]